MSTKTLTRADLTEAVFAAVGLPRNEASQLVEDILEEVCGALSRGETVKLSSFRHVSGAEKIATRWPQSQDRR